MGNMQARISLRTVRGPFVTQGPKFSTPASVTAYTIAGQVRLLDVHTAEKFAPGNSWPSESLPRDLQLRPCPAPDSRCGGDAKDAQHYCARPKKNPDGSTSPAGEARSGMWLAETILMWRVQRCTPPQTTLSLAPMGPEADDVA